MGKKAKGDAGAVGAGGSMIFESPWAIVPKVKKKPAEVNPVEAIMRNRQKMQARDSTDRGGSDDEGAKEQKAKKKKMMMKTAKATPADADVSSSAAGKKRTHEAEESEGGNGAAPVKKKKAAPTEKGPGNRQAADTGKSAAVAACLTAGAHNAQPLVHPPSAAAGAADFGEAESAVGAATGCGFHELDLGSKPLSDGVLRGVAALGFVATTPVQQATIPLLLNNKDVAVQACTGSGKACQKSPVNYVKEPFTTSKAP